MKIKATFVRISLQKLRQHFQEDLTAIFRTKLLKQKLRGWGVSSLAVGKVDKVGKDSMISYWSADRD